jgi:hypothetical protein
LFLAGRADQREKAVDQFAADTLIPPKLADQMPRCTLADAAQSRLGF